MHDLQWAWSLDPNLETVNISASIVSKNPCLDCACAESEYYSTSIVQDYLRNKTVDGARGVAFSVLGYELFHSELSMDFQCSGVPTNYLSFVIIDGVEPGDEQTELMFNVTSFTGATTEDKYSIHACMCFLWKEREREREREKTKNECILTFQLLCSLQTVSPRLWRGFHSRNTTRAPPPFLQCIHSW